MGTSGHWQDIARTHPEIRQSRTLRTRTASNDSQSTVPTRVKAGSVGPMAEGGVSALMPGVEAPPDV